MSPEKNELWFLPLGGTGEIGMNVNLYAHNHQWLLVDCGVTFEEPLSAGSSRKYDLVTADISFIEERMEKLVGIIITHAHEDHLGALPYLWKKFRCSVYTTAFSAEVLRRKLCSKEQIGIPIIEVETGKTFQIGAFSVSWMHITHSLPEPNALLISTPAGNVFHTADWKIDKSPICGKAFDSSIFKALSQKKVLAMVCDSTNALRQGHSVSEIDCYDGILELVENCQGKVITTCFASNIARLITLNKIAQATGRYMSLAGRSLNNMLSIARVCGYWPDDCLVYPLSHMGYLPDEEVLVVATGSQGDDYSALTKMAHSEHKDIELRKGDYVIYSSIAIPGNEQKIAKVINKLNSLGVQTFTSEGIDLVIHASGHPYQDELAKMYKWVQPKIALPVHGEKQHMIANAQIAKRAGIPTQMVGQNGDLFKLSPQPNIQRGRIKVGRIALTD